MVSTEIQLDANEKTPLLKISSSLSPPPPTTTTTNAIEKSENQAQVITVSENGDKLDGLKETRFQRVRKSKISVLIVVCVALFVEGLVYGVSIPILPNYSKKHFNVSSFQIGLLFACHSLGMFLFTPIFGVMSDKFGRKWPMLLGMLGLFISTISFALSTHFYQFFISRFAQGVSSAAAWVVGLAMIADVTPHHLFLPYMGIALSSNTAGYLVGPPIGSAFYNSFGFHAPFYFCALIAMLDFLLRILLINEDYIVLLRKEKAPKKAENGETSSMIKLLKSRIVVSSLIVLTLCTIVLGSVEPTLPLYLKETFGLGPSLSGFVMFSMILSIIPTFFLYKIAEKIGNANLCLLSLLFLGISLFALSLPSVWMVTIALAFFGTFFFSAVDPVLGILADTVDAQGGGAYAQAYALYNIFYGLGLLCGPPLGGELFNKVGFFWSKAMLSAVLFLFLPFGFFWMK